MINEREPQLDSSSQLAIAKVVASLQEESVSMVWRSELNESLLATARKCKRRRFVFNFLSPMAGLSVACVFAFVLIVHPLGSRSSLPLGGGPAASPLTSGASSGLEAGLLRLHQDDVRIADVTGSGLNPTEAAMNACPVAPEGADDADDDMLL